MTVNNNKNEYANLYNQNRLNSNNALLGGSGSNISAGLSGDLLQQWNMRGPNASAYRKLLEAQETGSVKQTKHYTELMSDKYFNDNYDKDSGKIVKPTYKPESSSTPTVDAELTPAELLDNMRRLALSAINNPDALNTTHYDLFEQMRAKIAGGLVTSGKKEEAPEVVKEAATAAKVETTTDFHLLTDQQNFTIAGAKGEKNYNFSEGESLQSIVTAINTDSEATGVKAEYVKGADGKYTVSLTSTETGKDALIRVDQNIGTFFTESGKSVSAKGKDAVTEEAETVVTDKDTQAAVAAGLFGGTAFGDESFTIQGNLGAKKFEFKHGATADEMLAAINAASDQTGVTAHAIYNNAGDVEGIGLLAAKAGSGQYVQVTQHEGDLFGDAGKVIKVAGTSSNTKNTADGPAINALTDLGVVHIDGKTYSFADLAPGGSASLEKNPDAALAVLDQAMKDIYEGRANVKGFDADAIYVPAVSTSGTPKASTNAITVGDFGSDAIKNWIAQYVVTGGSDTTA